MWQTERLTIRQFRPEDWSDLHVLQGDPEATKFIGGTWTLEKTREVTERSASGYATNPWTWYAVAERKTGRVLGACWLGRLNTKWSTPLGWGDEIELGYRYAREYWGNGYATEAGEAMLRRGFDELDLSSIVAIVNTRNAASERVIRKLGMKFESTADVESFTVNGYRLTRDAFYERAPRTYAR